MSRLLSAAILFLVINLVSGFCPLTPFAQRKQLEYEKIVMSAEKTCNKSPSNRLWNAALLVFIGGLSTMRPIDSALAISGGGKDYAEQKISGQDFSGKDYSGKDFSGAFAQQTNFKGSILKGSRFYKANLKGADFTGADISGASFEGASLDDVVFKDAIIESSYFTETLSKAGDVTGADFSETLLDRFVQKRLCEKASGVNPKTKVDTRESLLCD